MKYAKYNGEKTHAKDVKSGDIGYDLWFDSYQVVACVGKYRQYWKYIGEKPQLPNGYEPETEWHAAWKYAIRDEYCEVICGENKEHRADIKTDECVIEIQKSSIDGYAVVERNNFYKKLTNSRVVWVVNVEEAWKNKRLKTDKLIKNEFGNSFSIIWSYAWKWVQEISKTTDTELYLDFNAENDKLIKMWTHKGGLYGSWISKQMFFEKYLSHVAKDEFFNNKESFLRVFKNIGN